MLGKEAAYRKSQQNATFHEAHLHASALLGEALCSGEKGVEFLRAVKSVGTEHLPGARQCSSHIAFPSLSNWGVVNITHTSWEEDEVSGKLSGLPAITPLVRGRARALTGSA